MSPGAVCIWESPPTKTVRVFYVDNFKHAWSSTSRPGESKEIKNLHFRRSASPLLSFQRKKEHDCFQVFLTPRLVIRNIKMYAVNSNLHGMQACS